MRLCQWVCKSISEYIRTLTRRAKYKDTGLWIKKSIQESNFPLISYVTLAVPLKAKDAFYRQKLGGKNS